MRRALATLMLGSVLACSAPPPAAVPTETPVASVAVAEASPSPNPPSPTAQPVDSPGPVGPTGPQVLQPIVTLDRKSFPIGAIEGFIAPSAEDIASLGSSQPGAEQTYSALMTKYANLPRLSQDERESTLAQFDTWIAPGPFADLVKGWLAIRYADETKTVSLRDFTVDRWYAKPWGRTVLADARFGIVINSDTKIGTPSERRHDVRVRLNIANSWRIIDAFDVTAGRWLIGDLPRFSPFVLENEVTEAVSQYLWSESYLSGAPVPGAPRPPVTAFWKARIAALNELAALYDSGKIRDRHFDDVAARIVRFDPATFFGDGVLEVAVTGKLVEVNGDGKKRVVPFTQHLRFLRSYADGVSFWTAADAQEPDGSWDSGGILALGEIDRSFG